MLVLSLTCIILAAILAFLGVIGLCVKIDQMDERIKKLEESP